MDLIDVSILHAKAAITSAAVSKEYLVENPSIFDKEAFPFKYLSQHSHQIIGLNVFSEFKTIDSTFSQPGGTTSIEKSSFHSFLFRSNQSKTKVSRSTGIL